MRKPQKEVKLMSYEDILGVGEIENVTIVSIDDLHTFTNHPFKVLDNDEMDELVESIMENGIQIPLLVRPLDNGGYEIIAGHRRRHAALKIGLSEVPVIIRNMDYETAVKAMVASNKQREHILPSEKAFAYRMDMEATRHPGKRGNASAAEVGKDAGDSGRQVQRYIRLTYLAPCLLDAVDVDLMTMQVGVALSYLKPKEQEWIQIIYEEKKKYPNGESALRIKKLSEENSLTFEKVADILSEKKSVKRTFTLKKEAIQKYFPEGYGNEQIEEVIYSLLERWKAEQR